MNDEEILFAMVAIRAEYGLTKESYQMMAKLLSQNLSREKYLQFVKDYMTLIVTDSND